MSVSNFCVSSTLSNSSDAMVQKHSFDYYSFKLLLSQIPLHNFLFVAQNSQALKFLVLLNHPSQFFQQITITFLLRFLTSLNLMIQNLLMCLLKHLIFHPFQQSLAGAFFSLLLKLVNQFFPKIRRCLTLPPYFKFLNYRSNLMQQQHCLLL